MSATDYTIIGTVLALAVAILLLSGLALYVAFRVRETLRDEKGGSTRAVKVAFLIGMLFLSGGVFYFFASGFNASGGSPATQTTATTGPTSSFTSATQTSAGSSQSTSSTATSTMTSSSSTTTNAQQGVSMPPPSCAGKRVTAGTTFSCSVDIYDAGGTTFSSATLVSSGDFAKFSLLSCDESVNGGTPSPVACSGSTVAVGSIVPNVVVLSLTIQAPSQSGQEANCVLTLSANGLQPVSVTFSIQVTA